MERFIAAARVRARVPPKVPRAVRLTVMCINLWDHHHHRPRSINNIRWRTVEGGGHKLIPPYHEMACLSLKISILITFFFYVKFKKILIQHLM